MSLPFSEALQPASGLLDPRDPSRLTRSTLCSWLRLQRALALRPARARELLARNPDPEVALRAEGVAPTRASERALERAFGVLREGGVCALPCVAAAYPARLARLPDPALLLLVRGDARALSHPSVAIVGARAATRYGLGVAGRLAGALATSGLAIVSGLARGIDAAAHRAALEVGGLTIAVQACGPERVYPPEHRALAARIAESGAVVCELPPGAPPRAPHFPLRNRLISGLAHCVIVVEARVRSGSLTTARHALDQGIDVMAVPGPIDSATSAGTNALIRDGATPVLEPGDVLRALGLDAKRGRARKARRLTGRCARVAEALGAGAATTDELARQLELPPEQLSLALLELELAGDIERDRDGRWRRAAPADSGERASRPADRTG